MKNIYFVDEHKSSKVNGIGTFRQSILYCLRQMNVRPCVVSFNDDVKEFTIEKQDSVTYYRYPTLSQGNFITHPHVVNRLMRLHIKDSADNVFCFNHSPCDKLLTAVRESFPLSKMIFIIHDMGWCGALAGDEEKLKEIISTRREKGVRKRHAATLEYFDTERKMYSIVDKVVCLSASTYRILTDIYKVEAAKIALIPNGIQKFTQSEMTMSKQELKRDMKFDENEKILICIGRLNRAKGVLSLLRAFAKVLERDNDVRLVLVGSAQGQWDEVLASTKGIASKVTFTGHVSKEELSKLYQIADVGIIPSFNEQCPYAGIEMMKHGLPVVGSDAIGVRDMFPDGVCSVTAQIGDRANETEYISNLTDAISVLLSDSDIKKRIVAEGSQVYENTFSIETMQRNYIQLLENI